MEEQPKSLSAWRLEIKQFGKKHWLRMYKEFLGQDVSNIPRFYKALNLYGEWALFEAIIACAEQDIKGDSLNYVLAVTKAKWKESQLDEEEEGEYLNEIKNAKEETKKGNEALAKKLKGNK